MKTAMSEADRARIETEIAKEIQAFLDELDRVQPCWDDGNMHSIKIEGAVAAWSDPHDNDSGQRPLYSFRVIREQESEL